jgi:hypothetical protein
MTDIRPLYVNGKRDSRRRYVLPSGEIISRRQYIKITEGLSPEQKAVRRSEEGKSKAGVTVKKYQRKKKTRKDIKKPATEVWGDEDRGIRQKFMPTGGERGYYQLQGEYRFYHPKFRSYADSTGYSTADDVKHSYGSPNYLILRRQAIMNAVAKLDGYEWKYIGVIDEKWLVW